MATSRRFQAEMETTDVRQFGDEAVVPDLYTLLRVIRFGFPADLFSFCQIFKVAHYPSSLSKTGTCELGTPTMFPLARESAARGAAHEPSGTCAIDPASKARETCGP